LAGISKDACDASGGTWCRSAESSCKDLKDCIEEKIKTANATDNFAFKEYLIQAPNITDPTDIHQCGRVRGYFGFDELFINDQQVCEDIEQLKDSRDFEFLNEFFKQGSDKAKGPEVVPELTLTPPDRSTYDCADQTGKH
jgi:hypothetical protein